MNVDDNINNDKYNYFFITEVFSLLKIVADSHYSINALVFQVIFSLMFTDQHNTCTSNFFPCLLHVPPTLPSTVKCFHFVPTQKQEI